MSLEHAFSQPKSHRTASYAQGGILIHPLSTPPTPIYQRNNDYSITTSNGPSFGFSSPSSIELYTIILAIQCMKSASLTGAIYTIYQKAVRVANNSSLLHSMGREGDLPFFKYLIILLQRSPPIRLVHEKAHVDIEKAL